MTWRCAPANRRILPDWPHDWALSALHAGLARLPARREPLIHPRQLVEHRCITHRAWSEWLLRSENEDYRYLPDNAHMTDNLVYAGECAIAGAGITLLPAFLLEDKIEKGALVKVLSAWSVGETISGWPTRVVSSIRLR